MLCKALSYAHAAVSPSISAAALQHLGGLHSRRVAFFCVFAQLLSSFAGIQAQENAQVEAVVASGDISTLRPHALGPYAQVEAVVASSGLRIPSGLRPYTLVP